MAVAEREITTPTPETSDDFAPQPYRWTLEQFHQMGEACVFEGMRVVLMEGEILVMPPVGDLHRGIVTNAGEVFRSVFGSGFFVSEEKAFNVQEATDPQPDIAVISGNVRDFLYQGLTEAALIVEVSDSTLSYDRRQKASLYAKAGIVDYWIINISLEPAQIEVYRQPAPDETQLYGFGYTQKTVYQSGELILPLSSPQPVAVSALLP
jgi:Uma2 family endonuclease